MVKLNYLNFINCNVDTHFGLHRTLIVHVSQRLKYLFYLFIVYRK